MVTCHRKKFKKKKKLLAYYNCPQSFLQTLYPGTPVRRADNIPGINRLLVSCKTHNDTIDFPICRAYGSFTPSESECDVTFARLAVQGGGHTQVKVKFPVNSLCSHVFPVFLSAKKDTF